MITSQIETLIDLFATMAVEEHIAEYQSDENHEENQDNEISYLR